VRAVNVGLGQLAGGTSRQADQQVSQALEDGDPEVRIMGDCHFSCSLQLFQSLGHRDPVLHEHAPNKVVHWHSRVVDNVLVRVWVVEIQKTAEAGHHSPMGGAQQPAFSQGLAQLLHAQQSSRKGQSWVVLGVTPERINFNNNIDFMPIFKEIITYDKIFRC